MLFHQKRAFTIEKRLAAILFVEVISGWYSEIANQSKRAIWYNHLSIYSKMCYILSIIWLIYFIISVIHYVIYYYIIVLYAHSSRSEVWQFKKLQRLLHASKLLENHSGTANGCAILSIVIGCLKNRLQIFIALCGAYKNAYRSPKYISVLKTQVKDDQLAFWCMFSETGNWGTWLLWYLILGGWCELWNPLRHSGEHEET